MSRPRCSSREAFERRLLRFPPILVRLLARDPRGHALSTAEIAARSGLSPMRVAILSESLDWTGVDIPTFQAYTKACNLDLLSYQQSKRQESYLDGKEINGVRQGPKFLYLKLSPYWEEIYRPLMQRYIESLKQ